jgi:hypothetical protein
MREACPLAALQLMPDTHFGLSALGVFAGSTPPPEGFHLCLWRTAIGSMPRHLPPRRHRDGRLFRPSLPLDLHFLLMPVSSGADKQAQMLGWALGFMNDLPVLSGETLNQYTKGSPTVFAAEESVELIADPLPVPDYLALWDRFKPGYQPGMTYIARMVLIDSEQPETQGGRVIERAVVPPGGAA